MAARKKKTAQPVIDPKSLTLEERKGLAAEQLAVDRHRLLRKMPFIGSLLMRLDPVPVSDDRLETAATDGDHIYVDIDFYASLTPDERLFVLAHETWHCALLHFARRGDRDHELFNYATDLEIHFLLTKDGLQAPFVLPHDPAWDGLSAEQIYEKLKQQEQGYSILQIQESEHIKSIRTDGGFDQHFDQQDRPDKEDDEPGGPGNNEKKDKGQTGSGGNGEEKDKDGDKEQNGSGDGEEKNKDGDKEQNGSGFGDGEKKDGTPKKKKGVDSDYSPEIKSGAAERCRERLTSAIQQYRRSKGDFPAGFRGVIESILEPEVNWRELLAQFVTSCYGGGRQWLPPARRHVWQGLYLQSMREQKLTVCVAVDTSGSTTADLPGFFSEISSLLMSFGQFEITLIQCDAKVQHVEHFDDMNPVPPDHKWEVHGGGGTDFRPVFSYLEAHPELEVSLLIYLTDGYGNFPEHAPQYPVLWMLTGDSNIQVPWGLLGKFKDKRT